MLANTPWVLKVRLGEFSHVRFGRLEIGRGRKDTSLLLLTITKLNRWRVVCMSVSSTGLLIPVPNNCDKSEQIATNH